MPQWNLNVTPGGATGGLSAPQIGGGNMNWGPLMDMLRWRMQMQERGESARLEAIKQQMKMAKEQYRAQKIERGKAGMKRGLGRADTSKIDDYMKAWRMAQSMVGPGTLGALGSQNPLEAQQLTGMIGAIGPQAAHEGMMQYGGLMAGMAGAAARQPRKSYEKGTLGNYQAGTVSSLGGPLAGSGKVVHRPAQAGGGGGIDTSKGLYGGLWKSASGEARTALGTATAADRAAGGEGLSNQQRRDFLSNWQAPQAPTGDPQALAQPVPPGVPPPVDPGAGFEAILNPQSANLGMNVAQGMQPGAAPPMAPTAPSVQPRPGNVTGDPMAPGQIFGGDPQAGTGLQAQKKAQGAGFQFGGGVPETGTYRLHKGEIEIDPGGGFGRIPSTGKYKVPEGAEIIPTKLADVLMPSIAASRKSKGKAKKDYQEGTPLAALLQWYREGGVGNPPVGLGRLPTGPTGPTGWTGGPAMPGGMVPAGPSGPGGFPGGGAPPQIGPGGQMIPGVGGPGSARGAAGLPIDVESRFADDITSARKQLSAGGKSSLDDAMKAVARGNIDDAIKFGAKLRKFGKYGAIAAAAVGGVVLAMQAIGGGGGGAAEAAGGGISPAPGPLPPVQDPQTEPYMRQFGRALGYGADQLGEALGFVGEQAGELARGFTGEPATPELPMEQGPVAGMPGTVPQAQPGPPIQPEGAMGIPGLEVTEEPLSQFGEVPFMGGMAPTRKLQPKDIGLEQDPIKKYTLAGKPETPEERQQTELDSKQREIDRHKEQADSLSTSALKYERWARENPNKPAAQQLWAMSKEHMANSKQMYSTADALQKSLDARRGIITEAEAELEVAEVQAGGYVGSAQIKAAGEARKEIEGRSQESLERSIEWYRGQGDDPDLAAQLELLNMWRNNPEMYEQFKRIVSGDVGL